MKTLLLYNLQSVKGVQIRQLAASLQIVCKDITPEEYLKPVGSFAGFIGMPQPSETGNTTAFADEMMVFCGFESDSIYDFLARYKAAGIAPVWLKASLTPHNVHWNSLQLHRELSEEHRQLNNTSR